MKNYTVYRLCFPNGKSYVGVTSLDLKRRIKNGYKHNKYMQEAINQYGRKGIKKEVLAENLSGVTARKLEQTFIKLLKSNDLKYGYNISKGGTIVSQETYDKIKDISVRNNAKSVLKFSRTGDFIESFPSISDAVRSLNKLPTPSNCYKLVRCCKQLKGHKTYNGFVWKFEKPLEV